MLSGNIPHLEPDHHRGPAATAGDRGLPGTLAREEDHSGIARRAELPAERQPQHTPGRHGGCGPGRQAVAASSCSYLHTTIRAARTCGGRTVPAGGRPQPARAPAAERDRSTAVPSAQRCREAGRCGGLVSSRQLVDHQHYARRQSPCRQRRSPRNWQLCGSSASVVSSSAPRADRADGGPGDSYNDALWSSGECTYLPPAAHCFAAVLTAGVECDDGDHQSCRFLGTIVIFVRGAPRKLLDAGRRSPLDFPAGWA